jgi:hypothetical protein
MPKRALSPAAARRLSARAADPLVSALPPFQTVQKPSRLILGQLSPKLSGLCRGGLFGVQRIPLG